MSISDLSNRLAGAISAAEPSVLQLSSGCRSSASAIAWSETHAIAASHTTPDGDRLVVRTPDGQEHKARVVGRDPGTDLALLEVEGGGLKPLAFRKTDEIKVGHLAIALGRPGKAIRASSRMIGIAAGSFETPWGGKLDRYIESDRGFPAGFQGGPLIDEDGQGIGLSTDALIGDADLAVPTETIERVVNELLAHGRVRAGYLGVAVRTVRLPDAIATAVSQSRGGLVIGVADGSPAHTAGLVLGDTIVKVDGKVVRGPRELAVALRDRFGKETSIEIVRAGQPLTLTATPAERGEG
jgi:S1-C subfamily serine protease